MPSEHTERRLEEVIRLVRQWFPVFMRMVRMVMEWEELQDRDERVSLLALASRLSLLDWEVEEETVSSRTTGTRTVTTSTSPPTRCSTINPLIHRRNEFDDDPAAMTFSKKVQKS